MIGMFDSGSGGLTVLRALHSEFCDADVVYFGDILHAPYGSRSREELSRLTMQSIERLRSMGANRIVSACNSVSASLAISLFDSLEISPTSLIEMVGPTVMYFKDADIPITVCATPATVESGIYQNAFQMIGHSVRAVALPELAGAIEKGEQPDTLRVMIQGAFANHPWQSNEVLVLACTHYPLVRNIFHEVLPHVQIFDPAIAVAERIKQRWWPQEVGAGTIRCIISKDSDIFRSLCTHLFPTIDVTIEIVS